MLHIHAQTIFPIVDIMIVVMSYKHWWDFNIKPNIMNIFNRIWRKNDPLNNKKFKQLKKELIIQTSHWTLNFVTIKFYNLS
jgi:hypothetical protein